jgi:cobalamin biosynthesis protein CobD/CbiB
LPQRLLLGAWAQTLQRQTGGPVMYQHQKLRRARLGPVQQPTVDDLSVGLKAIAAQQNALWLLGLTSLLWHFG